MTKVHDIQVALAQAPGSARGSKPGVMAALTDFVTRHLSCGQLAAETTDPGAAGYMLSVSCPCGVTFMRWVTPVEAARELVLSSLIAAREADRAGPSAGAAGAPVPLRARPKDGGDLSA
jgi:hypothetical protein